jgi:hypothetical protein
MAFDELTERMVRQDPGMARAVWAILGAAIKEKSLLWVSLLAGVGLWTWTMLHPDFWRIIATACYTLGVYLPMLLRRTA